MMPPRLEWTHMFSASNYCKKKVARAHPRLDLSNIIANGAILEEGGREEGSRIIEEEIIGPKEQSPRCLDPG